MRQLSDLRCVVFGGWGFIGSNLCRSLASKVSSLRVFGRRRSSAKDLDGIEWIKGDFLDPSAVASAVSGCDVVIHLVANSTPASSNVDKVFDYQSNVVASLQLLEACREARVRRVVYLSSGGTIYGIPEKVPTPESVPLNPISAYGITKLTIEKYLALYDYLYGIEYRVLRVSNPYGPFQVSMKNQGVVAAFLTRALTGRPIEIWGDGSIVRDYIYIEDVVESLELALTHEGQSRIFNIGSGHGLSLNEIYKAVEQALGRNIEVRYYDGRKVDVPCNILDVGLAEKDLRWKPKTSFPTGLRRTIAWFQQDLHTENKSKN